MQLARSVINGQGRLDGAIGVRMLDCLNCMRCVEICPSGVRTDRIVVAARAELAKKGKINLVKKIIFSTIIKSPLVLSLLSKISAYGQRWIYKSSSLLEALVPKLMGMGDKNFPDFSTNRVVKRHTVVYPVSSGKRAMKVGYFIGCATNLMFPDIAEATIRVLNRNNIEVVVPGNQVCCGIPVYTSGDFKNARKLAEKNRRVFLDLDIDYIVTDCASCSEALKYDIEEFLGVELFKVPVYDLNEFLVNVIEIDRRFGEVPMTVTYHDPCHLGRGQKIYDQPRTLLKMVPGVEFVEMKDADRCCGGAGSFSFTHHDLSRKVGAYKVENIRDTGAEWVSTPCPSCKMQLDDLIGHEGLSVRTIHPVEVLDKGYSAYNCSLPEHGTVEKTISCEN
ncbi:Lactate utilization protein A [subsurface metagenome]